MQITDRDGGILVLGGTSLVGRFLLPRLAAQGLTATAVSRDPPTDGPAGVTWVRADVEQPGWAQGLPRAATVLSLSPIWLLPAAVPALLAGGMSRIVAFSSTSRFTKQESPDAHERAVARRLAEGEAAVMGCGAVWTVLRPTLIYAEGRDGNVTRLARLISRFGVLPLAGRGEGLRQPVHADDLAAAVLLAAASPAARDRAYELPGGETLTYRDMAARVFRALGKPPRLIAVPPLLWRVGLTIASPLLPGATAAMGLRMAADLTFDGAPAARDFGWASRPFAPDFRDVEL